MTADGRTFVDTNVLVYAHDRTAGARREAARGLLSRLWEADAGVLSTQVLQEFYVTVTRKIPQPLRFGTARDVVAQYRTWPCHRLSPEDVIAASHLQERHTVSFWDATIIVAALALDAETLASEDLQAGRRFDTLTVVDPFASPDRRDAE